MTGNSATVAQALALQQQGRLADAAALCREVLAREPRNSDAMHVLGLVAATAGDVQSAVALLGAALQLQPGNAAMHANPAAHSHRRDGTSTRSAVMTARSLSSRAWSSRIAAVAPHSCAQDGSMRPWRVSSRRYDSRPGMIAPITASAW